MLKLGHFGKNIVLEKYGNQLYRSTTNNQKGKGHPTYNKKRKSNRTGHILRRNYRLKHIIEGNIKRRNELTRR
jgi:phage gpG-like protein